MKDHLSGSSLLSSHGTLTGFHEFKSILNYTIPLAAYSEEPASVLSYIQIEIK